MPDDLFSKLEKIGTPPELMGPTIKLIRQLLEPLEAIRACNRDRQKRYRNVTDNVTRNVTSSPEKTNEINDPVTSPVTSLARVEDTLLCKKISGQIIKKDKKSAREELMAVLDAEHADAVLEHRKIIRKPMTPFAAKNMASRFAQCPDPNAAAALMVSNGWQGFKPSWLDDKPQKKSVVDVARKIIEEQNNGSVEHHIDFNDAQRVSAITDRGRSGDGYPDIRGGDEGYRVISH